MEKLTDQDVKFLKKEITQILSVYGFILILVPIFYLGGFALIDKYDVFKNKYLAKILMSIFLAGTYSFFVFISIAKPIKDLISGEKSQIKGILSKKSTTKNHGATMNPKLNAILIEYFITVNATTYSISKNIFKKLNEGDNVTIYFTLHTGKIIDIQK